MDKQERVVLTLTKETAEALAQGAELLARLGLGQLDQVAELVRQGHVPVKGEAKQDRQVADAQACDVLEGLLAQCKGVLGFSASESNGITHPHCSAATRRAWDAYQSLSLALRCRRQGLSSKEIQDRLDGRFRWIDETAVMVSFVDPALADEGVSVAEQQVAGASGFALKSMEKVA